MKTTITILLTLLITTFTFATSGTLHGQSATEYQLADNLLEAVSNIDMVSVNVLLSEGADINRTDQNGNTPLMIAAKIGNPRIIKILLAHNPGLNLKNNEGNTALMIASEHGQTFVVEQLIEKGADLYAKNTQGFAPAEIARRNGHAAIVHLLRNKNVLPLSR